MERLVAAAIHSGLSCLVYGTGLGTPGHPGQAERIAFRDQLAALGVDARFPEHILRGTPILNGDFLRSELVEGLSYDFIVALQPPDTLRDAPTLRGELHDLSWMRILFPRVMIFRPMNLHPDQSYLGFEAVVSRFEDDHVFSYDLVDFRIDEFIDVLGPWLDAMLLGKRLGLWPDPSPPLQPWLRGVTY